MQNVLALLDVAKEFKRSHRVIRRAHEADRETWTDENGNLRGGGPDHPTRLKAADLNLRLLNAFPDKSRDSGDPQRPIAVQIVLTGHTNGTGAAIQANGVRFHLDRDRNG